jgi:hypothetical protein
LKSQEKGETKRTVWVAGINLFLVDYDLENHDRYFFEEKLVESGLFVEAVVEVVVRDQIRLWVVHETELVVLNHLKEINPYDKEELGKVALEFCAQGLI